MVNNYEKDEDKTTFSWSVWQRTLRFLKPYKKTLTLTLLLSLTANILLLLIPKIMNYAIDNSFINKDFPEIIILSLIILAIAIISVYLTKKKRDKLYMIMASVASDLKIAIFQKLQYLPNTYYDTKSHGKIYTRATSYPDDASGIICYVLVETILDVINLIFCLIFMFTTNIPLSFISLTLSLILIVVLLLISPLRRKYQQLVNDKNSNVNAYLNESINGIRITQSFNREQKNEKILRGLEREKLKVISKSLYLNNINWSLSSVLDGISMALIYFIGLRFLYPGISLGVIIAIDSYSSRFWEPISYLSTSYSDLIDASTYLERIFELLDEPISITDHPKALTPEIKGHIKLANVTFSYDSKTPVLKNLNLEIKAGEKVGIVGATGSGKSTILSLLTRFYDVTSGAILIDDTNILDIKLSHIRSNISMMLQDNYLFERSVYDNLILDKKIPLPEVEKICKLLDAHDIIMKLPQGYATILQNNASSLSTGERQLLCMARIMLQNPKILILDEATSNIDLKTENKITKALDIITKNRTTIMVAHRLSTIKKCDKIVLIKDHTNYEEGTHQKLMAQKGEYYKLYTSQSSN